jgi:hypothetical protein
MKLRLVDGIPFASLRVGYGRLSLAPLSISAGWRSGLGHDLRGRSVSIALIP